MAARGLVHGPLGETSLHLCVDMQRLFAPEGPWAVPWAPKVLPAIEELAAKHPHQTVFTRLRPGREARRWTRHVGALLSTLGGRHPRQYRSQARGYHAAAGAFRAASDGARQVGLFTVDGKGAWTRCWRGGISTRSSLRARRRTCVCSLHCSARLTEASARSW